MVWGKEGEGVLIHRPHYLALSLAYSASYRPVRPASPLPHPRQAIKILSATLLKNYSASSSSSHVRILSRSHRSSTNTSCFFLFLSRSVSFFLFTLPYRFSVSFRTCLSAFHPCRAAASTTSAGSPLQGSLLSARFPIPPPPPCKLVSIPFCRLSYISR